MKPEPAEYREPLKPEPAETQESSKPVSDGYDFAATVAHEIRTPLNVALGFLSLLQQEKDGPLTARQQDMLAYTAFSLGQVRALLEDLLSFSQLEHNQLKLELASFDLGHLVKTVLTQLNLMAEAAKVSLEGVGLVTETFLVYGDQARFTQCLNNLIVNSLKFSPLGGTVTVSIEAHQTECVVKVRDKGPGISPENQDVIFKRHFQTAAGTLHHLAGYGLGLSITKELIEQQGGRIWLESLPGEGSTFFLSLPCPTLTEPAGIQP